MIRRLLTPAVVAMATLAPVASAQRMEVAPFLGYRAGSDLADNIGRTAQVPGHLSYGGVLSIAFWPRLGFELLYSHQGTTLVRPVVGSQAETFDLAVDQWGLAGFKEFSAGRFRPFLNALLGITRFTSADFEGSDTQFTFGPGLGVKLFTPSTRVGLRIDARSYLTLTTAKSFLLCDPPNPCAGTYKDDLFFQGEVTAAVVIALRGTSPRR